jgi:group I intron endonuclease
MAGGEKQYWSILTTWMIYFMAASILIYRFTNLTNGKIYIGKTSKSLAHRRASHVSEAGLGCKRPFHAALRKYGVSGFCVEVIDRADDAVMGALKEQFHIFLNDCKVPRGYNLTDGGEGAVGRILSKEHREKLRIAALGRIMSPESRRKMSIAKVGKRHTCSLKTSAKITATLKGRPHSKERIDNIKRGVAKWRQTQTTQQ